MGKHPALANQRIDQLFLDTTYASPKHTFPSQVWHFTSSQHLCRRSHGLSFSRALLLLQPPVYLSLVAQSYGIAYQILILALSRLLGGNVKSAPSSCAKPLSFVFGAIVPGCFTSIGGNIDSTVYCIRRACQQPCAMLLCKMSIKMLSSCFAVDVTATLVKWSAAGSFMARIGLEGIILTARFAMCHRMGFWHAMLASVPAMMCAGKGQCAR